MSITVPESPTVSPPSRLAPLPFYYGWIMLVLAAAAMTATLPGRTHGLGLITKPLIEDSRLGVSELLFGTLNFWAILLGSALCLPVGRLIDRLGVRVVLVSVAVGLGAAVLWMSQVTGVVALFVALVLIRGLGQGSLSVVSMAMIGKWFTRRLGPAMGIYSVLLAIGFIASTLAVGEAVKLHGWRDTWAWVGWSLLLGLAPLGWLLARNTPEAIGLEADQFRMEAPRATLDMPVSAALRCPAFWIFTLAASLFNLVWSAITLFNESILEERHFDHDTFVLVMATLVATGLPANLLTGWLAPRWGLGRVLAIGMFLLAGSLVAFPALQTRTDAICYGAALGVAGGIITVVYFTIYRQAFGRKHLGTIQAVVQMISVLASALGPLLVVVCKDATGSYQLFFYCSAPLAALLGAAAWFTRLPEPERNS